MQGQMLGQTDTVITGRLDVSEFQQAWAAEWKQVENAYIPDSEIVNKLKPEIARLRVWCRISMGTWCSDSQIHVPAFLKIAGQCSIPFEIWGVSREKECPWPDCTGWTVQYVPTFEVFSGPKEMGRIVESPVLSIEADMWNILQKTKD